MPTTKFCERPSRSASGGLAHNRSHVGRPRTVLDGVRLLVTGSSGLIGSEAVEHFDRAGHTVVGVDNNMRQLFFGPEGDTSWNLQRLKSVTKARKASALLSWGIRSRKDGWTVRYPGRPPKLMGPRFRSTAKAKCFRKEDRRQHRSEYRGRAGRRAALVRSKP